MTILGNTRKALPRIRWEENSSRSAGLSAQTVPSKSR